MGEITFKFLSMRKPSTYQFESLNEALTTIEELIQKPDRAYLLISPIKWKRSIEQFLENQSANVRVKARQ